MLTMCCACAVKDHGLDTSGLTETDNYGLPEGSLDTGSPLDPFDWTQAPALPELDTKGLPKGQSGLPNGQSEGLPNGRPEDLPNGQSEGLLNGKSERLPNGRSESQSNGQPEGVPNGSAEGAWSCVPEELVACQRVAAHVPLKATPSRSG